MPKKIKEASVEIMQCPHGYYAVVVNDHRVTPTKCCGTWLTKKSFLADTAEIKRAINSR